MKLYLANTDAGAYTHSVERLSVPVYRILVSFHYFKNNNLDNLIDSLSEVVATSTFADSGAFSSFTQGVPIDLDQYIDWIRRFVHLFDVYGNLDVIGSPSETLQNQRYMEAAGLSPLPVFHVGEPWDYLEQYIDQYLYIALGGLVPYATYPDKIMPWLARCFRMADTKAVYHGFGVTGFNTMYQFPWYSVDSSAWMAGVRYGRINLFDEARGRFETIFIGDKESSIDHSDLIQDYGVLPRDIADRSRVSRYTITALCANSYLRAANWITRQRGEVSIPQREGL